MRRREIVVFNFIVSAGLRRVNARRNRSLYTGCDMPDIEIVEVSPRDGLQNEPAAVSTADKVALVRRAVAAGARRVEAVSFVNPARVPQMADAAEVMTALCDGPDLRAQGVR